MLSNFMCFLPGLLSSRHRRFFYHRAGKPSITSEHGVNLYAETSVCHLKKNENRNDDRAEERTDTKDYLVNAHVERITESRSRLLALPPEIRVAIFAYLIQNHPDVVTVKFIDTDGYQARALLNTNPDTSNIQGIRSGLILRDFRKRLPESQAEYRRYGLKDHLLTLHPASTNKNSVSVIPILLTCKQLYSEALPLLFAHTTFVPHVTFVAGKFASAKALLALTCLISEKNAALIRSVRLDFHLTLKNISPTSPKSSSSHHRVGLSKLEFPDPTFMALCLQHLTGLRQLVLNLEVVGTPSFYDECLHTLGPKARLTIQGQDAIEAFKPIVAWTETIENCELIVNVDKSGFHWERIGQKNAVVKDVQQWCKQMEDKLLHLYSPEQVTENRRQDSLIPTYGRLLNIDVADFGPSNWKAERVEKYYFDRFFSDRGTKLYRQALGFSSSKDFVYLEQTACAPCLSLDHPY